MNTFSGSEAVRFGWETFKKRSWFFIGVTLLVAVASGVTSGIVSSFGHDGVPQMIGSLINLVISTLIGMGVTAFFLKAHDSLDAVQSADLWHPKPFWSYLATRLLLGVVVVIGLILLIVPGFILGLMFMFSAYIVIDKGLGPIEAMKESKRITDGHKWNLLGFGLLLILLNILGAICLLVGLLVSVPVTSLALVHAYRTLSSHEHPHATA